MSNTTLLLHIGLPKTGTATLQRTLFLNHPQVHYLGKIVTDNDTKKGCIDDLTYSILDPVLWALKSPMDTEATLSLFQDKLLPTISEERVLVGSWEGLGTRDMELHVEMLDRIKAIFGGCRIMITLRNPLSLLPSLYLQYLGGYFIRQNKVRLSSRSYVDIETWYSTGVAKLDSSTLMNCCDCIRSSIEKLGRENVGVFLFEDLKDKPTTYYQSICEFMGIDSEMGVSLAQGKHFNTRLSEAQLAYMREIDSSWTKFFHSSKSREEAFNAKADGPPAKAVLNDQLIREVSDATRVGHRWLVENLNLPLEKYGYPL